MRIQVNPNGGHNDSLPPYGIRPNQLANAKNWRTVNGELRTAKGYITSTSSVINGVTGVRDLSWAVRADGTEDLIGWSRGDPTGQWKIVGDTKTIIPTVSERGTIEAVSGVNVTGDVDCRFLGLPDASNPLPLGYFWMDADGIAEAVQISTLIGNANMVLVGAYGGATTAGAYTVAARQGISGPRSVFWNDSWFFAQPSAPMSTWDGTTWREVSFIGADAVTALYDTGDLTVVTASGGSLGAGTYWYKWVQEDSGGAFGAALPDGTDPASLFISATSPADGSISIYPTVTATHPDLGSLYERYNRPWLQKLRVYRASAASAGPYYYHQSVSAGVTAIVDDGTVSASTVDTTPVNAAGISAGMEDVAVFDNRLCAISGRKLYISGFPPTDAHTLAAGRLEPHVWPTTPKRVGDGEETGTLTLVVLRGQLFVFGSDNIWKVERTSDDPETWPVFNFLPGVGCASRVSIANGGQWVYFLARIDGRLSVARFNGRNVENIGLPVDAIVQGIDTTKYADAVGGVAHGFYWLTIPAATYKTVEFNTRENTWCWRDWRMQAFAKGTDEAYMALVDGIIYKPENGYDKAAAAQAYSVDSAAFHMGRSEWPVRFENAQLEFQTYAGSPEVSASRIVDEGTAATLPAFASAAVSATPIMRTLLTRKAYGQRMQFRVATEGTGIDLALRQITLKGEPEEQDMS